MSIDPSSNWTLMNCCSSRTTILIFISQFCIELLVVLPLLLFVLYLGIQRWRQQRSPSMSHSDFFTYNMIAMDLFSMLAAGFYCFTFDSYGRGLQWVGNSIYGLTNPGQTLFHLLTCVERYLAVVHPITYLGLKQAGGVRIRNVSTGCVWLLCFGMVGVVQIVTTLTLTITYFGIMTFFLVIVCFCTVSILCVLKHPGPGEVGGDRERADQSKQRAFHTVVAILVALLVRLFAILVCCVMFSASPLTDTYCAVGSAAMFLAVPCSLVLPLLFLQRAGKLPSCSRRIPDAGQTRHS